MLNLPINPILLTRLKKMLKENLDYKLYQIYEYYKNIDL